jgi:hypothetical protein
LNTFRPTTTSILQDLSKISFQQSSSYYLATQEQEDISPAKIRQALEEGYHSSRREQIVSDASAGVEDCSTIQPKSDFSRVIIDTSYQIESNMRNESSLGRKIDLGII